MKIQTNGKLATLLDKNLKFAEFAIQKLKQEMDIYEKRNSMNWKTFLKKFESGKLGDDRKWFKWYALTQFTLDWDDTQKEIKKALRSS